MANGELKRELAASHRDRDRDAGTAKSLHRQLEDARAHAQAAHEDMQRLQDEFDAERARDRREREELERQLVAREREALERADRSRAEQERLERDYLREKAERERLARDRDRAERERQERERAERDRLDRERRERDAAEKAARERRERDAAAAAAAATQQRERKMQPKNYPELGLCLSDTLPRPITKGKKKVQLPGGKQRRLDGIKVVGVRGPAKRAGVLPEDTVRKVNGIETPNLAGFKALLKTLPPKEAMELSIERDGVVHLLEVVPNPSTEEPGNAFQRLVKMKVEGKGPDVDLTRLAAPKGQYYDDEGALHDLFDEKDRHSTGSPKQEPSTPVSPRRRTSSPVNPPLPAAAGGAARQSDSPSPTKGGGPQTPGGRPGAGASWRWEGDEQPTILRRKAAAGAKRGDSPVPSAGDERAGGSGEIRVGARVRRNPVHWHYGNQDGGEGSLGTVAKVDKNLGWVTVRWDATGRGSTYRWGQDDCWDVLEVSAAADGRAGGGAGSVMEAAIPPPARQRPSVHVSASGHTSRAASDDEDEGGLYPPAPGPAPTPSW